MTNQNKLQNFGFYTLFAVIFFVCNYSIVLGAPNTAVSTTTARNVVETTSVKPLPYSIEDLPGTMINSDFVVGPGKTEFELAPGESAVVNITVTNRMGERKTFRIDTEDFRGSRNTEETVVLLGNEKGPYSLKDYLKFTSPTFDLEQGQRITIPVTVSIPMDAEPGGRYGSVLVSTVTRPGEESKKKNVGAAPIITRIGTLLFIKVPGEVKNDARLKEFYLNNNQSVYSHGPVNFNILFENNGSVYLSPSAKIKVTNIMGAEVGNVDIKPWFAMPDSLRLRQQEWGSAFLMGRYKAVLELKRGYDDITDTAEIVFWVIPWLPLLIGFIILLLIVFSVRWVMKNFKIQRKTDL